MCAYDAASEMRCSEIVCRGEAGLKTELHITSLHLASYELHACHHCTVTRYPLQCKEYLLLKRADQDTSSQLDDLGLRYGTKVCLTLTDQLPLASG